MLCSEFSHTHDKQEEWLLNMCTMIWIWPTFYQLATIWFLKYLLLYLGLSKYDYYFTPNISDPNFTNVPSKIQRGGF